MQTTMTEQELKLMETTIAKTEIDDLVNNLCQSLSFYELKILLSDKLSTIFDKLYECCIEAIKINIVDRDEKYLKIGGAYYYRYICKEDFDRYINELFWPYSTDVALYVVMKYIISVNKDRDNEYKKNMYHKLRDNFVTIPYFE